MDLGISGRNALVLAGSDGLGFAVARSLASEGASVCLVGWSLERLRAAQAHIMASGGKCTIIDADLFDASVIDRIMARTNEELGRVDILFNNTGGPRPASAQGVDATEWRLWFDRLVVNMIMVADRVIPSMKERGWGRIITTTSSGVVAPIPNLALSNSLRLALCGWSKTLASELGPFGVTSNIIVPGRFDTKRVTALDQRHANDSGRTLEEQRELSSREIPVGRYGRPEEYGNVVAFLASDRSSYITGSQIRIDGGLLNNLNM